MSPFLPDQFVRVDDAARIRDTEDMRTEFRIRRIRSLVAGGMTEAVAAAQVDDEIRAGAALQAEPVRVTRS